MASNDFDEVVLRGTTYKVPKPDCNPSWGEELNDYLLALGDAFATLVGPGDIEQTEAIIVNNQVSSANVIGLSFDNATVRSAFIDYAIYRETSTTVQTEEGTMILGYDATRPVGLNWELQRECINDSGVEFTVTDAGQVQYTSDNMGGSNYNGTVRFRARSIIQS